MQVLRAVSVRRLLPTPWLEHPVTGGYPAIARFTHFHRTHTLRDTTMSDIQIHAVGLYAVNGLALSRRAARSHELREAVRERKRERNALRRQTRAHRAGRDAFTTAV